jgi:hypothetical protein
VIAACRDQAAANLYERGGNIALNNVSYLTLGTCLGLDGRRELLRQFQVMTRDRTSCIRSKPNSVDRSIVVLAHEQLNVGKKFITNLSAQYMRSPSVRSGAAHHWSK